VCMLVVQCEGKKRSSLKGKRGRKGEISSLVGRGSGRLVHLRRVGGGEGKTKVTVL